MVGVDNPLDCFAANGRHNAAGHLSEQNCGTVGENIAGNARYSEATENGDCSGHEEVPLEREGSPNYVQSFVKEAVEQPGRPGKLSPGENDDPLVGTNSPLGYDVRFDSKYGAHAAGSQFY